MRALAAACALPARPPTPDACAGGGVGLQVLARGARVAWAAAAAALARAQRRVTENFRVPPSGA
jgi:sugar (pentulose or hexulose) kinase